MTKIGARSPSRLRQQMTLALHRRKQGAHRKSVKALRREGVRQARGSED